MLTDIERWDYIVDTQNHRLKENRKTKNSIQGICGSIYFVNIISGTWDEIE